MLETIAAMFVGVTIGAHVGSYHDQPGYNNFNPGVYAKLENGATAGFYYNSNRRMSAYVGYTLETPGKWFALTLGAITGYERWPVMPLAVPSVRLGDDELAVRLSFIPKFEKNGANVVHLSLEHKF